MHRHGRCWSNPCDLVDCGQNAECLVVEDQAICECREGFELDGQDCVPENEGPTLQNLPAEESGARSESDSFTITATDPNPNDVLTFGLVDSTCPFDVQVVAATGVVTWNCPATTTASVSPRNPRYPSSRLWNPAGNRCGRNRTR